MMGLCERVSTVKIALRPGSAMYRRLDSELNDKAVGVLRFEYRKEYPSARSTKPSEGGRRRLRWMRARLWKLNLCSPGA